MRCEIKVFFFIYTNVNSSMKSGYASIYIGPIIGGSKGGIREPVLPPTPRYNLFNFHAVFGKNLVK